jgi:hypothetical protein
MAGKRHELKRNWSQLKWWFVLGTVFLVGVWAIQQDMRWDRFATVPITIGIVALLSELLWRKNNYVIFHEEFFDQSDEEWGLRFFNWWTMRKRVRYENVRSVGISDGVIEIEARLNPEDQRDGWPLAKYRGQTATFRFRPVRPQAVVEEIERQMSAADRTVQASGSR